MNIFYKVLWVNGRAVPVEGIGPHGYEPSDKIDDTIILYERYKKYNEGLSISGFINLRWIEQ